MSQAIIMKLKREKKKKRKIENLRRRQISKTPVNIGLKIIFIGGQRKVSTGRHFQSNQT